MTTSSRRRVLSGKPKSDINITPLIDVLLVLLVIFMVIMPVTSRGLQADVPQPPPSPISKGPQETLIVTLDRNGGIRLNQEIVQSAAIFSRLQDVLSTRADRTVFVQAEDEVLYNEVAQLIDMARVAGAARVGLMPARLGTR